LLASFAEIKTPIGEIESFLQQAQSTLNVDRILVDSIRQAGNVLTPMWFLYGSPLGKPDSDLPAFVQNLAIRNIEDNIGAAQLGYGFMPLEVFQSITPIAEIGDAAAAVGNINNYPDVDGGVRAEPLIVDYYGSY